jgi:hypothetical protein
MVNPVYYLLAGAVGTIAVRGRQAIGTNGAPAPATERPMRRAPLRPRPTVIRA